MTQGFLNPGSYKKLIPESLFSSPLFEYVLLEASGLTPAESTYLNDHPILGPPFPWVAVPWFLLVYQLSLQSVGKVTMMNQITRFVGSVFLCTVPYAIYFIPCTMWYCGRLLTTSFKRGPDSATCAARCSATARAALGSRCSAQLQALGPCVEPSGRNLSKVSPRLQKATEMQCQKGT